MIRLCAGCVASSMMTEKTHKATARCQHEKTCRHIKLAPFLTGSLPEGDAGQNKIARKVVDIFSAAPEEKNEHKRLMQRVAAARDKKAFAALFGHFAPRVKSFLLKQKLADTLAEDIAQDVLITVWHKAHLYDPRKANLSTWIFRIARNKLIDHKRRRKYPEVNADDHVAELVAPEKTDKAVEQNQNALLVKDALTKLSETQRTAIELSFFEELSHTQIAERLSIPLGTVKSRIRIAFNALRKELGEQP